MADLLSDGQPEDFKVTAHRITVYALDEGPCTCGAVRGHRGWLICALSPESGLRLASKGSSRLRRPAARRRAHGARRGGRTRGGRLMSSISRRENGDTMPYIVTTVRPPSAPDHSHSGNVIRRHAVVTLDGVPGIADPRGAQRTIAATRRFVYDMPEGVSVEIQATTWNGLAADAGWQAPDGDSDYSAADRNSDLVLAAYNAKWAA